NPESTANWNKINYYQKGIFIQLYGENLHRIECPLNSEYDVETRLAGKKAVYVELLPLDGLGQTPIKKEVTNKTNNVTFINYITNNLLSFGQNQNSLFKMRFDNICKSSNLFRWGFFYI
ncbi:MAG: hypothetical protein IPL95_16290, partial [Saprospiraceae bacterium]|nr:hypothetical protein [Saprospiraceae bacterium]